MFAVLNTFLRSLRRGWDFYLSGGTLGALLVLGLFVFDAPVGMSDSYLAISEYCLETFQRAGRIVVPRLDWHTGFLGGVLLGGAAAAILSGELRVSMVPADCQRPTLRSSLAATAISGFGGGMLVMLGLQLAGDSFLGQIAAAAQRSSGALLFIVLSLGVAIVCRRAMDILIKPGG